MRLSAEEIAQAVGGKLHAAVKQITVEHISTASGSMKGQDLFVPLLGAKVDAHRYIEDAFLHGAAVSFTSEGITANEVHGDLSGWLEQGRALIETEDTFAALQKLGQWYRKTHVHIPYVGVTGSVGKTTTREMIAAALSAGLRTYSTKGNANSQTGVPITVAETDPEAQIGVIEMGISEFGEMQRLSAIVQCDMAVVTTIGISHIANLGSQENIRKEKLCIINDMKDGGCLFLNADDPLLKDLTADQLRAEAPGRNRDFDICFYGLSESADIRAEHVEETDGYPCFEVVMAPSFRRRIQLKVPGLHMVRNALAAFAVAVKAGVDPEAALKALASFESMNGRGRILEKDGIRIIHDAYNAAPQSMIAGLRVLSHMPAEGRRIAVLADMLELGPNEKEFHREVGRTIAKELGNIDIVMLYGNLAREIGNGITAQAAFKGDIRYFDTLEETEEALFKELRAGDIALLKGSNSMKLSRIAEDFEQPRDKT